MELATEIVRRLEGRRVNDARLKRGSSKQHHGKPKRSATDLAKAVAIIYAKIAVHPALAESLKKSYAYTTGGTGIRHALKDPKTVDSEDAQFILVTRSAFINYMSAKARKAGICLRQGRLQRTAIAAPLTHTFGQQIDLSISGAQEKWRLSEKQRQSPGPDRRGIPLITNVFSVPTKSGHRPFENIFRRTTHIPPIT
jgi:hypothetical protein